MASIEPSLVPRAGVLVRWHVSATIVLVFAIGGLVDAAFHCVDRHLVALECENVIAIFRAIAVDGSAAALAFVAFPRRARRLASDFDVLFSVRTMSSTSLSVAPAS